LVFIFFFPPSSGSLTTTTFFLRVVFSFTILADKDSFTDPPEAGAPLLLWGCRLAYSQKSTTSPHFPTGFLFMGGGSYFFFSCPYWPPFSAAAFPGHKRIAFFADWMTRPPVSRQFPLAFPGRTPSVLLRHTPPLALPLQLDQRGLSPPPSTELHFVPFLLCFKLHLISCFFSGGGCTRFPPKDTRPFFPPR